MRSYECSFCTFLTFGNRQYSESPITNIHTSMFSCACTFVECFTNSTCRNAALVPAFGLFGFGHHCRTCASICRRSASHPQTLTQFIIIIAERSWKAVEAFARLPHLPPAACIHLCDAYLWRVASFPDYFEARLLDAWCRMPYAICHSPLTTTCYPNLPAHLPTCQLCAATNHFTRQVKWAVYGFYECATWRRVFVFHIFICTSFSCFHADLFCLFLFLLFG